jgi:uncharacterized protein YodC (DUF2158 family)
MSLKKGDTVRLKSGGPIMTVEALDVDEQVLCIWFEKTKKKQDRFPIAALEAVTKRVGAIGVSF